MPADTLLARARLFAALHPDDTGHAEVLARLDPSWRPPAPASTLEATGRAALDTWLSRPGRPPLDLTAARTARVDQVQQPPAAPVLSAAAVRMPREPRGASGFYAPDTRERRWVLISPRVPSASRWTRYARRLLSLPGSPFTALRVAVQQLPDTRGQAVFRTDPDNGRHWVEISVDPVRARPGRAMDRTLRHELAHVADETARRRQCTAAAWLAGFSDEHRSTVGESFARHMEDVLTHQDDPEETVRAAQQWAAARRPRRGVYR
ncbi:hypothetical protein KYY02_31165 [Streptomyces pimonensis]|uniref:Uncharacterized protein n=1 Tax=Streptomyces pimonensis TaxID=2860288 RepID=A0ABV4J7V5_9ACTN